MDLVESGALFEPGSVRTSSRVRMWWLTTVKDYRVVSIMNHPKKYSMGRLTYERTWVLKH